MPFKVNKDSHYRDSKKNNVSLSTSVNSAITGRDIPDTYFYELEPAEVLDIILDDTHPDFNTYEDIGKAKLRLIYSQKDMYTEELYYAKPLNPNIKSYPLKHEIVITAYYISREATIDSSGPNTTPKILYYFQRLNSINSVNHNALLDISLTKDFKENSKEYVVPTELNLGNTFKESNIHPLQHKEGDIIVEGRSGNSIRFGSENGQGLNPTLKIRNGQREDVNDNSIQPIMEDINRDGSSLWFTYSNPVPLKISSNKQTSIMSVPNEYSGKQIILNSDRIILNSKVNEILGFSNKSILFSSNEDFGIDSKRTTISSKQISLGGMEAMEPVVLGYELTILLTKLLTSLTTMTVATGTGIFPPTNAADFGSLQSDLEKILSKKVFTV